MRGSFHFAFRYCPHNIMWISLTLLLIVGTAVAEYDHGWQPGYEYQYLIRSRSMTGLDEINKQFSGILLKGLFTVQVKSPGNLYAKFSESQYARVHKHLPEGWDSKIPDRELEYRDLPVSENTFKFEVKHGLVRNVMMNKDTPIWKTNLVKSILSQLQLDTQGENVKRSRSTQVPYDDESPFGMFKTMEDSVGGRCEVLYEIMPLQETNITPELVPIPNLKDENRYLHITKTKNYSRCDQRPSYYFAVTDNMEDSKLKTSNFNTFISESAMTYVVISGHLKNFTIQSSLMMNKIFVKPRIYDPRIGSVYTNLKLTLVSKKVITDNLPAIKDPMSIGGLVYTYNVPFRDEEFKPYSSISVNSQEEEDYASSQEYSEEDPYSFFDNKKNNDKKRFLKSDKDEQLNYYQHKPRLDEPPEIPFLPYFIGYMGKNIQRSDKVNVVLTVKDLVGQIVDDLQNPTELSSKETLEKFSTITNLLRILNNTQIAEVERISHSYYKDKSNYKDEKEAKREEDAWKVIRDAIAHTGTGPALLNVIRLIESKKLEGVEASIVLSRLSKTTRVPTVDYLQAFFKLIKKPILLEQQFVNVTASIAFADLVYYSIVKNSKNPVFGYLLSKTDRETELETYVTYFADKLKKAIEQGDSMQTQTYIRALGTIGDPRILPIFEPYLEGKIPVSKYQRMFMVYSLNRLGKTHHKLVRNIVYKIYVNTMEAHEVRCMAVYILMMSNPPLAMLQRMAQYTNYDTSKHVNSAVKSSIESAAKLKRPEWQTLANNARIVQKLLNSQHYNGVYSESRVLDVFLQDRDFAYTLIMDTITDNSLLPASMYFGVEGSYSGFKPSRGEMGYSVSDINRLLDMLSQQLFQTTKDQNKMSPVAKIAAMLNIQPKNVEALEGNIFLTNFFGIHFVPFDEYTVKRLMNDFWRTVPSVVNDRQLNINSLKSYDVTFSFPTENGLPFVYNLNIPRLDKVVIESDKVEPLRNQIFKMKVVAHVVYTSKIQGRLGFVTPFEHHQYISGIDAKIQIYLPVHAEIDVTNQKKFQIAIHQLEHLNIQILQYDLVPYTAVHDILDFQPLPLSKNTHIVFRKAPLNMSFLYNVDVSTLKIKSTNDYCRLRPESMESIDIFTLLATPWAEYEPHYHKLEISMNSKLERNENIRFNFAYDIVQQDRKDFPQPVSSRTRLSMLPDNVLDNQEKKKQAVQEIMQSIDLGTVFIAEASVDTPRRSDRILLGMGVSDVEKERELLFNYNSRDKERNKDTWQVCAVGQVQSPPETYLDIEKTINIEQKEKMTFELQYGENCINGDRIFITGNQVQSEDIKEALIDSKIVKKCRQEMKEGNKGLQACQKAHAFATMKDEVRLSIDAESDFVNATNKAVQLLLNVAPITRVNVVNPKNAGKNTIDMKLKMLPNFNKADVIVNTPTMDITVPSFDFRSLLQLSPERLKRSSLEDHYQDFVQREENQVSCTVDVNKIVTFDDKTYFARLRRCWHTVMISQPQWNREIQFVPENIRVAVVAREVDDDSMEVRLYLGPTEVLLRQSNNLVQVTVNGRRVELSQFRSYKERNDKNEVVFKIYELQDGSIKLTSDVYDFKIVYDGRRFRIQASEDYFNTVRGLCGNYDGQPNNDFVTPKNCVLQKPEEFIATYSLSEECTGVTVENKLKAERSKCFEMKDHQSNVISDAEAGRSSTENKKWGYHSDKINLRPWNLWKNRENQESLENLRNSEGCNIYRTKVVERNEQFCFTTRPVPKCADNCKPINVKVKKFMIHCMERNDAAEQLKRRIEQGANPDMSLRSAFESQSFEVPIACIAA